MPDKPKLEHMPAKAYNVTNHNSPFYGWSGNSRQKLTVEGQKTRIGLGFTNFQAPVFFDEWELEEAT